MNDLIHLQFTFKTEKLNQFIEHTALTPLVTNLDIEKLIFEAREYHFRGVCVPPFWVEKTKRDLLNTDIQVVTVIGFPLGYNRSATKKREMEVAIQDGADELDLVMNLSAFKSGDLDWVKIEFAQMAKLAHDHEKILKIIIETAYLSNDEIKIACQLGQEAGADFMKTSTGFANAGATVEHIKLMRSVLSKEIGIKASGGIRTLAQAKALLEAGADVLGCSASVGIMKEFQG